MKFAAILTLLFFMVESNPVISRGQVRNDERQEIKQTRFPGSRMTMQGDVFMGWPFPVREWFVEGALAGYKAGYDQGCSDGKAMIKGRENGSLHTPADMCPNRRKFQDKAMFYAEQMTDFYTKYPEDRDLPLAYLIQMLVDTQPKTVDEIHQWVSKIGQ